MFTGSGTFNRGPGPGDPDLATLAGGFGSPDAVAITAAMRMHWPTDGPVGPVGPVGKIADT